MNAHDVIESWVRDVAGRLPRARRNDVACELRALLADELDGRARAEGRAPDRAMAMDLLKGFGTPAQAAGRYHDRPAIIDPTDSHHFVIWALGGAVVMGVHGLLNGPGSVDQDLFLIWLGILVVIFAAMAWWRRRRPGQMHWKPSPGPDRPRPALALLAMSATLAFPVFMYAAPQTFVQVMFLGQIADSGVALTEVFRGSWQRIVTLALLVLSAALYGAEMRLGSGQAGMRWASIVLQAGLSLMMLLHAAPMIAPSGESFSPFVLDAANATSAPFFRAVGGLFILSALYDLYRQWSRVRPEPEGDGPAR